MLPLFADRLVPEAATALLDSAAPAAEIETSTACFYGEADEAEPAGCAITRLAAATGFKRLAAASLTASMRTEPSPELNAMRISAPTEGRSPREEL